MAGTQVPLVVERDVDGFYVVECPVFEGCYTQGKTLDEALTNIREAIALALKEKKDAALLRRDLCAKLP
ncbi:type II toxin-antitoxin system HicB family antitoxin [bacterium]|nr:type II toxin-antitoxin system HicB family antitoxin [bacterium]